jgi:stearoyl-CoA desaturase (delta-9 desaturase)
MRGSPSSLAVLEAAPGDDRSINLFAAARFLAVQLSPLLLFWTGVRLIDLLVGAVLYVVRMLAVTVVLHRYFSHRSFAVGRATQLGLAILGCTAAQKGPLWWASVHAQHHAHTDTPNDVHSPLLGFWWSYTGWFLSRRYDQPSPRPVRSFAHYPELLWLDRHWYVPFVVLCVGALGLGGPRLLLGGVMLSTALLHQVILLFNIAAHSPGERTFETRDHSRNSRFWAWITCGEGWHNNHHHAPGSARFGQGADQPDLGHWVIRLLARLGLASKVRVVPGWDPCSPT